MRYTKLIFAFLIVMVIVVLVGKLGCDAYADVNEGLTLSSDFNKRNFKDLVQPSSGTTTSTSSSSSKKCRCVSPNGSQYNKYYTLKPGDDSKCIRKKNRMTGPVFAGPFTIDSVCTSCNPGNRENSKYRVRKLYNGTWKCPNGWTDTGCGWADGNELGELQCRAPLHKTIKVIGGYDDLRKTCNDLATNNKADFSGCKGTKKKKREKCVGKALPKCLIRAAKDEQAALKKKHGSENAVVTVYRNKDYNDNSPWKINASSYHIEPRLSSVGFNNTISSMKIPKGFAVMAYEHSKFKGKSTKFTGDVPYVGNNWNDKISSLRIVRA